MEAYIVEEPGGNFRKTDLPCPTLKPNHVLVRPLLYDHVISVADIDTAHMLVESGAVGKVVVALGG
jgi:hypothetical protein